MPNHSPFRWWLIQFRSTSNPKYSYAYGKLLSWVEFSPSAEQPTSQVSAHRNPCKTPRGFNNAFSDLKTKAPRERTHMQSCSTRESDFHFNMNQHSLLFSVIRISCIHCGAFLWNFCKDFDISPTLGEDSWLGETLNANVHVLIGLISAGNRAFVHLWQQ